MHGALLDGQVDLGQGMILRMLNPIASGVQRIISLGKVRSFLPLASAGTFSESFVVMLRKPASQVARNRKPLAGALSNWALSHGLVS